MPSFSILFEPRQVAAKIFKRMQGRYPLHFKLCSQGADCEEVFKLRYRAYLAAGLIEENESGSYCDQHDAKPSTYHIAAYDEGRLIGAIRFSVWYATDPASAFPCENVYPEIAALKAKSTGSVIEFSRMAVDPEITNWSYRTTLYGALYGALVRAGFIAAKALDAECLLVAARAPLNSFYERMCGFKRMAEPQLYPPGGIPVLLMSVPLSEAEAYQSAQNAFFEVQDSEIEAMRSVLTAAGEKKLNRRVA
jgi:N-acyl-L-homoserine lactone synthetase